MQERPAMLAVLDRAYGTPWHLAGAPVGWPAFWLHCAPEVAVDVGMLFSG